MKGKDTKLLLEDLASIIESGKNQLVSQVNSTLTLVYWQIGYKINTHILDNQRAEYGKEVVSQVSTQLVKVYGNSFQEKNLRRMMQFVHVFPDFQIVVTVSRQLSWSHFIALIPIKKTDALNYYIQKILDEKWSIRELRNQIERKAFERKEIAQLQLSDADREIKSSFKDPYFLDFLGLKEGYLENDLEAKLHQAYIEAKARIEQKELL